MDKVKVVQIGLKGFGEYLTKIIHMCSHIDLIGVYDIDSTCVAEVAHAFNIEAFSSLEAALASPADAVVLAVPNSAHARLVRRAALAGKHVFVEKPITNSIEEAEEIIRVCREQGVLLQVGHSMRFMGKYRRVRKLLEEHAIGRIVLIEANYSSERAKRHTSEVWRYSRETCPGGPMLQLGVHSVDSIHYLTGCKPLEIRGLFTDDFTDTLNEDAGVIIMKLENDILAYVGSSYVSPSSQRMVIHGDEGRIDICDSAITLTKGKSTEIVDYPEESEDAGYVRQFESFAASVLRGVAPEVDGETGLMNLGVVLTALKNAGVRR